MDVGDLAEGNGSITYGTGFVELGGGLGESGVGCGGVAEGGLPISPAQEHRTQGRGVTFQAGTGVEHLIKHGHFAQTFSTIGGDKKQAGAGRNGLGLQALHGGLKQGVEGLPGIFLAMEQK